MRRPPDARPGSPAADPLGFHGRAHTVGRGPAARPRCTKWTQNLSVLRSVSFQKPKIFPMLTSLSGREDLTASSGKPRLHARDTVKSPRKPPLAATECTAKSRQITGPWLLGGNQVTPSSGSPSWRPGQGSGLLDGASENEREGRLQATCGALSGSVERFSTGDAHLSSSEMREDAARPLRGPRSLRLPRRARAGRAPE